MRKSHFFLLLVFFVMLAACSNQTTSLALEDIKQLKIEGCGLDQSYNEKTSTCERKLTLDTKQDIEIFSEAIEKGTVIDGPLTTEGDNFVYTFILESEEAVEYKVWIRDNWGSFEKTDEENVRYRFQDEDRQKISDLVEREMK